jgi:hypothetical protein
MPTSWNYSSPGAYMKGRSMAITIQSNAWICCCWAWSSVLRWSRVAYSCVSMVQISPPYGVKQVKVSWLEAKYEFSSSCYFVILSLVEACCCCCLAGHQQTQKYKLAWAKKSTLMMHASLVWMFSKLRASSRRAWTQTRTQKLFSLYENETIHIFLHSQFIIEQRL